MRRLLLALTLAGAFAATARAEPEDACARPFRGKRVNLAFRDAPVAEVFRFLARVGDANVVLTDDVKGTVSVDLKKVPWDQAMCAIAGAKQLDVLVDRGIYTIRPR